MTRDPAATQRLARLLQRLRRRYVLIEGARISLWATAALLVGLWCALLVEALAYLPPYWRFMPPMLAVFGAGALAVGLRRRGSRAGDDEHAFAIHTERRIPALRQRLITALELDDGATCSADLLAATRQEALQILSSTPAGQIVPGRRPRRALFAAAGVGGLTLLLMSLFAQTVGGVVHRWTHPGVAFARPQRTHVDLDLAAGPYVAGDDVDIQILLDGQIPATTTLRRRHLGEETWIEEQLPVEISGEDRLAAARARFVWRDVRQSFEIQALAGDGRTQIVEATVIDPPVITGIHLEYDYPDYSGLPRRIEEEGGDIRALAGTRIRLTAMASKNLAAAWFVLDDSTALEAQVADRAASVTWTLPGQTLQDSSRVQRYHLRLEDGAGIRNPDPIHYAVEVLDDMAPTVVISVPGHDSDLPDSQRLILGVEATDDYGLSKIDLVYQINDGPAHRSRLGMPGSRQASIRFPWDLTRHDLLPEDRVHYHVEAFDNDVIGGPRKAVSQSFTLRFPSLYELFDDVSEQQEQQLEALEELADEDESARDIEQLRREALKNEDLNWQERKELEAALAEEAERAEAVQELARQMSQTMDQLEESGLGSEQLMNKLEQIRELMSAVTSPEMQEALEALEQAAQEDADPQQLAEALRKFAEDQEQFQQRLDRTISLLRQIQAEQRLTAATEQAEDLAQRQAQINEELNPGVTSRDMQRLADQEARLAADTDRLQEELEDLGEQMEDLHAPTSQALQAEAETMEAGKFSQRMRSVDQQMQAGESQQAKRRGESLQDDLGRLSQAMQKLQSEFSAGQRESLMSALQEIARDVLDLSFRQEYLRQRVDTLDTPRAMRVAPEQFALGSTLRRVIEALAVVGRQTMTVHPGLPTTLGYALHNTEAAAGHLGQQERHRALELQGNAMMRLNEAVSMLRESASDLSQSQMPSGFGEAMEKMMGLSQQQAALNEATQQAMQQQGNQQGQGGQGGMEELMSRLAAEQRRIHQALSELERSLRGQRSMQERVGRIQQEMGDVVQQLEGRRPRSDVAQRQQQILQRMLDASRSIHSRGFERKRRSQVATRTSGSGPEGLPPNLGQHPDRWREAMQEALSGDYPDGYRRLVQRYYEAVYSDLQAPSRAQP